MELLPPELFPLSVVPSSLLLQAVARESSKVMDKPDRIRARIIDAVLMTRAMSASLAEMPSSWDTSPERLGPAALPSESADA